ncbi:MAG: hypothetical protein CMC08_01470 [Flavobacteriaceae bacterium]|nr:hypothetical protein [Flavobacteriaceae bacterium]
MGRKIAFIGPLPPPVGGVALANLRVQRVLTTIRPHDTIINYNTSKGQANADLYKRKSIAEFFHLLRNIGGVLRFVARHRIEVSNVFVVPNISFVREAIFIIILKLTTRKLVIHLHAKTEGDYFLEGWKLKVFTKIIALGDVVFVLSEKFHRKFYAKYINERKLVVLENFIEDKEFDNPIDEKQNDCLYVGRLSEKKGFFTLVEAVSKIHTQFPHLKIHVLGEFENADFEQKVTTLLAQEDISAFHFYGAVMGEEKAQFFKENKIFLFPSYFENSPIVLKEAVAAKMAILASDIKENKNILDPIGNTEYFRRKDSDDLADKLSGLLLDQSRVRQMMHASENAELFNYSSAREVINIHI